MPNIDNYLKVTERDGIGSVIVFSKSFDSSSLASIVEAASECASFQITYDHKTRVIIYRRLDPSLEARALTASQVVRQVLDSIRCVVPCEESGHTHECKKPEEEGKGGAGALVCCRCGRRE